MRKTTFPVILAAALVLLCVIGSVLSLVWLERVTSTDADHQENYENYIADDYLPWEKQRTGQWPKTLAGLPQMVASQRQQRKKRGISPGVGQEILRFQRENACSLSITHESENRVLFILNVNGKKHEQETTTEVVSDFEYFVEVLYMVYEKKRTGMWPRDLARLPQVAAEQVQKGNGPYERQQGQQILRFLTDHRCTLSLREDSGERVTYDLSIDGEKKADGYSASLP